MPRRQLSERQRQRIRARQEARCQQFTAAVSTAAPTAAPPRPGLIVARHGATLAVEDSDHVLWRCVGRQHLGHLVCGDRVLWQPTGAHTGIVVALLPRDTVLSRSDRGGRDKPLAANLSLLIAVVAPEPPPLGELLDQYLVAAEIMGIAVLVVCNKMDLLTPAQRQDFLAEFRVYEQLGYPVRALSVGAVEECAALAARLRDEAAILVGQSGVGKSSLAAALLPDRAVQVGRLSAATGLGRHTTTATTRYRLPGGGALIDSPGVRGFRLGRLTRVQLEWGFRELRPYRGRCRFNDCRHEREPECAVQAALAAGVITARRLNSFQRLARQLERPPL